MTHPAIDRATMIGLLSEAATWQAEALRRLVSEATLLARQGRAVKLADLSKARAPVAPARSAAPGSSPAGDADFETLLGKTFASIDGTLLQAVQATRRVLQQFADQGAELERGATSALASLEKIEDAFLATVIKATRSAGGPLQPTGQAPMSRHRRRGEECSGPHSCDGAWSAKGIVDDGR